MKRLYPFRRLVKVACAAEVYRPRVETLEERLPPGDILLGKIWGASWWAANASTRIATASVVSAATPSRWSAPAVHNSPVARVQRPAPAQTLPENTQNRIAQAAITSIGVDDVLDPLAAISDEFNPVGSRKTAPPRSFEGAAGAAHQTVGDGGAAAAVGASSTPAAAAPMSQPATTETGAIHPVNDLNTVVASTLGVPLTRSSNGPSDGGSDAPPPSGRVHALFQLDTTTGAPFPADRFTVADRTQNTARRVNLPYPDCSVYVSDCQDIAVLNELDGFNLQPRLSVPFDGAIDVNSVSSQSMFLVSLGDTLNHHDHGGQVVGINQVVWDTFSNTLHVESDQLLDQHTRYALIVTDGIQDQQGHPVQASSEFRHFRHDLSHSHDPVLRFYGQELEEAVRAARHVGVRERDIVDASVFTTQSATAILEKIRDQIHAATPAPADFNLGANGERTVFALDQITGITFNRQVESDPPKFIPGQVDLSRLGVIPGAVGEIAFGKYFSPDYEVHPGEYIPAVGTRTGAPAVQSYNEIYFNLFLPSGSKPADGWPVAIFGHALSTHKQANEPPSPIAVAAKLAEHGIATIAINAVGHGYGPLGTLTVNQAVGEPVTFLAGGRGIDQNGDHVIEDTEGLYAAAPESILWKRDGQRQTVADLMQLVRVIEVGMDASGGGTPDLDASRIYYAGASLGSYYGGVFLAVEPDVRAGVLTVPGGSSVRLSELSPSFLRSDLGTALATRVPSLVNSPGISALDGVPFTAPYYFNENMPLRDGVPYTVRLADGTNHVIQSPVINTVPGAMAIQEALENQDWVLQAGDPLAYAPHLRQDPLPGVPAKSVVLQVAKGDEGIPNPIATALVRAGELADQTTFYRHDLAYAENADLPKNPHFFMLNIARFGAIALGAQEQIATFFASDGTQIIHPEPARFFETPIQQALPEDLNYIP